MKATMGRTLQSQSWWWTGEQRTASADPNFDQSTCGQTVSDFNSDAILTALNKNASEGVEWVRGVEHPVLSWDAENAYVFGHWCVFGCERTLSP